MMVGWMQEEPGREHYHPEYARPGMGPEAPLSAVILRTRMFHPGADCLLPLLARLVDRPVALITRVYHRYQSPWPKVRVYRSAMFLSKRAEVRDGRIVELERVAGTTVSITHDPAEILVLTRYRASYTPLVPRNYQAWLRVARSQVWLGGQDATNGQAASVDNSMGDVTALGRRTWVLPAMGYPRHSHPMLIHTKI